MSKGLGLLITLFAINVMLVVGGVMNTNDSREQGGMISTFYEFDSNNNIKQMNETFTSDKIGGSLSSGVVTTGSFTGFTDLLKFGSGVFNFLLQSLSAPLQLMFNPNLALPTTFRFMIGSVLTLLWALALFLMWMGRE